MSYHRARASLVPRSPCASATPIASCRAAPLAYASMILDCQPVVAAERRRPDWTIHVIRPARISTPRRIHSQSRLVPESPEVAAPGEEAAALLVVGGAAVAVAVAVTVVVSVGVGVGVALEVAELTADAALLVALPIALLALRPHPVIRHPATMMATGSQTSLLVHRMLVLSLVAIVRPAALAPVRRDQAGHQSGQEHLAGQGGQRSKAEVLECLGIGRDQDQQ